MSKQKYTQDPNAQTVSAAGASRPAKKKNSFFRDMLSVILMAVALALVIKIFIVDTRVIPSGSMEPTIMIQDRVVISKFAYHLGGQPERGDIIVFKPPEEFTDNDDLIKRVIGLPGETIEIFDGTVYVDGAALSEPYLAESIYYEFGPITIPEDCVFVLGDNRNYSNDGHLWLDPFVEYSDIKGKALCIYWPLNRIGGLKCTY